MTRHNLDRIEATLSQLAHPQSATAHCATLPPPMPSSGSRSAAASVSFQIGRSSRSRSSRRSLAPYPLQSAAPRPVIPRVSPLPARSAALPALDLPKFKLPPLTQHQNSFNMALPMTLVKQIEAQVEAWQIELRQILDHIQALYTEGPIVNGWLDPHNSAPAAAQLDATALQDADPHELMQYIDHICDSAAATPDQPNPAVGYQLCGLYPDGRVWCKPCPPEQVPTISLAIARYRKLRVLLQQKEQLELRLQQAATALMEVQAQLHPTPQSATA